MSKALNAGEPAPRNPFIIGHHAEGEGFCDRRAEVGRIAGAFRDPASRLLVYGDRRLGKSSTIREAAEQARRDGQPVVVVDLAVAASATAAAQRILTAVHDEIGSRWRDVATQLLARLRPGTFALQASLNTLGLPSITFQVTPGLAPDDGVLITEVLDAIEAELRARDLTLGLALDEFQRMGKWYGDDVAWQLKELLERHRRIAYVLAGSERSMIEQMLANRKAGLWKVVEVLDMQPIPPGELAGWISSRATTTGVMLDVIAAATIVRIAGPRTRDVVQLARATWDWGRADGLATRAVVLAAMEALVVEQGALHQRQWDRLTDVGRRILVVAAMHPDTPLTAAHTLAAFALGPKSTVQSAIEELAERELLVRRTPGAALYDFDDPFFRRWVQVYAAPGSGVELPPRLDAGAPATGNAADASGGESA